MSEQTDVIRSIRFRPRAPGATHYVIVETNNGKEIEVYRDTEGGAFDIWITLGRDLLRRGYVVRIQERIEGSTDITNVWQGPSGDEIVITYASIETREPNPWPITFKGK